MGNRFFFHQQGRLSETFKFGCVVLFIVFILVQSCLATIFDSVFKRVSNMTLSSSRTSRTRSDRSRRRLLPLLVIENNDWWFQREEIILF
jgi:hypothetical protein